MTRTAPWLPLLALLLSSTALAQVSPPSPEPVRPRETAPPRALGEARATVEPGRPLRTVESLEAELAAERARREQLEAEVARLRAHCQRPSPVDLVFHGLLEEGPVTATRFTLMSPREGPSSALQVERSIGYSTTTWALVALRLRLAPGREPTTLGSVRLTEPDGSAVKVLTLRMDTSRLSPGERALLVAELESPPKKGLYRLEVLDAKGERCVPLLKANF